MAAKGDPRDKGREKAARRAHRIAARTPPPGWQDPLAQQQPLISGRWLVRTLAIVFAVAAACAYLTLCLLFYQGQWQIVFHPSRSITTTPSNVGLQYDEVRFDYTGTGAPQLAGWWVPADPASPFANRTVLFLHGASGSLSDTVAQLKVFHSLGVNAFAFDYRGFGQSAADHPSESRVYDDAEAAWRYLTDIRHQKPASIFVYGDGLGATIAAETAIRHRDSSGLILENPAPPALSLIEADARTSILPVRWLFRDRFEIAPKLQALRIGLTEPAASLVAEGRLSPSTLIVRQEKSGGPGPRFLVLLGPHLEGDRDYLTALSEFLHSAWTRP